jgi:hypothetical protein
MMNGKESIALPIDHDRRMEYYNSLIVRIDIDAIAYAKRAPAIKMLNICAILGASGQSALAAKMEALILELWGSIDD